MGQAASTDAQDTNPGNPDAAWWCKMLAKVCGALSGVVCIITGILVLVSLSPLCIVAGLLMMVLGFVVLVFEVPICCTFVNFTQPIASFAERRTYFQKALIFGISAIVPVAMCFGVTSVLGCILVFATGVLYGLMALGRKADRDQMAQNAAPQGNVEAGGGTGYEDNTGDNLLNQQQNPFGGPGGQQKQPASVY